MRILIVTNHFWPENFRINDLAVGLKERGHEVNVLTGIPDYPAGRFYSGYGVFKRQFEEHRGIKVARFPLIPRGRGRSWELVLHYLSSALFSCICAPFYCRSSYDVIFVFETSPITIALPAILLKWIKKSPIVLWVLDLWPESLSATGAVRSPRMLGMVRRLVRFIYRRCDRILVSSRGFSQNIIAIGGYEQEPVYFPNWIEPEYMQPEIKLTADVVPMAKGFRIMFAGNIGAAQDFGTILSAAEKLICYTDIHWVIVGDGRMMEWVKSEVEKRNLRDQVHLLGRYPAEMMPGFYARADALLMTLRREPIFTLTAPGKLQSYMACGKPIIASLDGEGAKLVKEAGAGLVCPAENPAELAERVLQLYRMHPEERKKLGENGKRYCLKSFDRKKQFDRVERLMTGLATNIGYHENN